MKETGEGDFFKKQDLILFSTDIMSRQRMTIIDLSFTICSAIHLEFISAYDMRQG